MAQLQVGVSDSVFPNLDPARAVLSKIGAELHLAEEAKPEAIMRVARTRTRCLPPTPKSPRT